MTTSYRRYKKELYFILTTLVAIMLIIVVEQLGFFAGIDAYTYDTYFRIRGARKVSDRIVIAAIDEKALGKLGRWPLQRGYYARLLEQLDRAAVIGFDLIITEPTAADPAFAAAIKKQGKVILPVHLNDRLKLVQPLPAFTPFKTGHIHVEQGVDNVTRAIFHTLYTPVQIPSLSSVMYETVTGAGMLRQEPPLAAALRSSHKKVFQQDVLKINFYGPPGTFPQISVADIITGNYPAGFFNGKAVLIGLTAPGIVDELATPFSQNRNRMAGVEVHANMLNNLLDNSHIQEAADWQRWLATLLASLCLSIILLKLNERNATLLWLFSLLLTILSSFLLFATLFLWLSPALFFFSFSLVYIITYLYRLDCAARELDSEHSVITALLGSEPGARPAATPGRGLIGLLSAGGINDKIQRLLLVEQFYGKKLEETVQKRTQELSDALAMISNMSNEMIQRLTRAVGSRDEGTGEHIVRVGLYAEKIATLLGMPADFVDSITFASAMHDVGKIGIPDRILLHPGELDDAAMKIMKQHCVIGERILKSSPYPKIQMSAVIALNHHEKWDGSGYPTGLKGEEIPIEARIIIICDCYDALRSKRHYKPAFDHQTACRMITRGDKKMRPEHFEPRIMQAFIAAAADFEVIFATHQDRVFAHDAGLLKSLVEQGAELPHSLRLP